jgi:predicted NAD/FAD-binding protein
MNILQGINAQDQFCVTLNHSHAIRPDKIIQRFHYSHPVFNEETLLAQQKHEDINGLNRTYYCGAYWRNGFHEDGVVSALHALQHFQNRMKHEKRDIRRAS